MTRAARQRANDCVLLFGLIFFFAAVAVILAMLAGWWEPPGVAW